MDKLERDIEPLRKNMKEIDELIHTLPEYPQGTTQELEKFLLDNVDTAPSCQYRKECVNKILQLIKVMDEIEKLHNLT